MICPANKPDITARPTLPAILAGIAVALAGGLLWRQLALPLPWLVGTLCAVAAGRIAGLRLQAPPSARQLGQWSIGVGIGLHFTPAVGAELLAHAGLVAVMAASSLLLGGIGAATLVRRGLADAPTAFFAALPGGASEMARLAELQGGAVDRVAAAHALRILLVVLILPLALTLHPGTAIAPAPLVEASRLPGIFAAGFGGVLVFRLLHLPTPWVLGPLFAVAALTLAGLPPTALPAWIAATGQLLVGLSLGMRFGPDFLRRAPAFISAIGVMSLGFLVATGALALLLGAMAGVTAPTLVLALAPGGIAEMSITASHLQLGVPLVVATHVSRVVLLLFVAPLTYPLFARRCDRPPASANRPPV